MEHLGLFQDLKLRADKLRIGPSRAHHVQRVNALVVVGLNFHRHLGQVLAGEKHHIDTRRDHHEEEREEDQPHAHFEDAPDIEEVQFDFGGFVHWIWVSCLERGRKLILRAALSQRWRLGISTGAGGVRSKIITTGEEDSVSHVIAKSLRV
jgi:hypothetical protein